MDTISLSRTVLVIFDFKVFRVWPWPLTPKCHLGSKKFIPFESPYMTSYLTSMDTISLSCTVLEIFDFKVFRVWPWPLTPKCHPGSNNFVYPSKARIWLPIRLLWTSFLYLVPFSRYSTSKFLGFDLDLWPLKVIWGQKIYTLRKPIYDVLFDFYEHHLSISYRFRDIRLQSFQGLTLTPDPKRSSGVKKIYTFRKPIYDFLFDFYEHHLSISYRFRDKPGQNFEGRTKWRILTFSRSRSLTDIFQF